MPTYNQLPITEEVPTSEAFQLPVTPENTFIPSLEVASRRARKADLGLGELSPGRDALTRAFVTGNEENMRQSVANTIELQREQERLQALGRRENRTGEIPTKEDLEWVLSMSEEQAVQPFSVFEDSIARQFIDHVNKVNPEKDTSFDKTTRESPELVELVKEVGAGVISTAEYAKKLVEDLSEEVKNQSLIGFGVDLAKFLIPFYYDIKMRDLQKDMDWGPLFTGTNLEEQRRRILSMHPDAGKKELIRITDGLKKDNPTLALLFSLYVASGTSNDALLDNVFMGFDIASVIGSLARAGKATYRLGKEINSLANATKVTARADEITHAIKDVVKASSGPEVTEGKILAGAGDVNSSAVSEVARLIAGRGEDIEENINDRYIKSLTSGFRTQIDNLKQGPMGNVGREAFTRLISKYEDDVTLIERMLEDMRNVERLTPEALQTALRVIQDQIKQDYKGQLDSAFLDIGKTEYNSAANVYNVRYTLGDTSGQLFGSKQEASMFIRAMNIDTLESNVKTIEPKQYGTGWAIEITRPVKETDPQVRQALMTTKNETPVSLLNTWIGALRTPEDTLSEFQRSNRHIATYAPNEFVQLMFDMGNDIRQMGRSLTGGKKRLRDLERVLKAAAKEIDPATKEEGYFYKTIGELEESYVRNIGRAPTEQEVKAYFAFVRINELDWVFRNAAIYRNKHRVGAQEVRLGFLDGEGKVVQTDAFDAIPIQKLPWGQEAALAVFDSKTGTAKVIDLSRYNARSRVRKLIEAQLKDGQIRAFNLYDGDAMPLRGVKGVGNRTVHYVVANSADMKPLRFDQLPRRGGGHIEYTYQRYIRQAKMRREEIDGVKRSRYVGDYTVMAVGTNAQGQDIVKHLNKVSEFMAKDDKAGARAYLEANTVIPWEDYLKFDIDFKEPFHVVPRGRSVIDVDKNLESRYKDLRFKDSRRDSHNPARMHSVAFTDARDADLYTVNAKGSLRNPAFKWEPAKTVDPLPMMNRAMKRIINSRWLDDYKMNSIESWAEEVIKAGVLTASPSEIRGNPLFFFHNHDQFIRSTARGSDELAALENSKQNIQQLLGQPSSIDAKLHALNQKIVDTIYHKAGPRSAELTQNWLLPAQAEPWQYLRSAAFHAKLGLFSWVQVLVQAQTFTHILGVAGAHNAFPGASGALMTMWALARKGGTDTKLIQEMDKRASKLGWKPGEFAESHNELMKTGFARVMGEHAILDAMTSPQMVRGPWGSFLDGGSFFFRNAERSMRLASWHTAFKEFRRANPTGRITNKQAKEILDRADLLNVNMSAASNSALHRGIWSVPTQFLTYQLRLAEQFLGKRLTRQEKLRAFATYSAMYGVPLSLGVTGVPMADWYRQAAFDAGIDVNENWYNQAFFNGMPAVLISLITGEDVNYGERLGIQGFTTIREGLWADRTWYEILGGAAGSVVGDTLRESEPLMWAISSMWHDDVNFPIKTEDVINAFGAISSLKQVQRGWIAYNTGVWESRRGRTLQEKVSPTQAVAWTLSGLQPDDITSMWDMTQISKFEKEEKNKAGEQIVRQLRRAYQALANNDEKTYSDYMSRAKSMFHAAGFQPGDEAEIIARANRGWETVLETASNNLIKTAPKDKVMPRQEMVIRKQQRDRAKRGPSTPHEIKSHTEQ